MRKDYQLKYTLKVERGPFSGEEVKGAFKPEDGAADAIVVGSVLFGEKDGHPDIRWFSRDGRVEQYQPLRGEDLYLAWHALAHQLQEDPDLPPVLKAVVNVAVAGAHMGWAIEKQAGADPMRN